MIYYFSGGLTRDMIKYLKNMPEFSALDVLVSQLDKSSISDMISYQAEGIVNRLFIDSGAFSVHTGKAKVEVDDYIDYLNSIDDHITVCAQLDTIPGTFGQPKSSEDYEKSAKASWDNYIYMRSKLKSPHKLMPVFHFGESFEVLNFMLNWQDDNGHYLDYIGISPANDVAQKDKNVYLQNVYDVIADSNNPGVKTHLYGMTSLDALSKYPCYSADSVSHRLQGAYGKVYTPMFGTISVSKRDRTSRTKSNMSFIETADSIALQKLKDYLSSLNVTISELQDSHSCRCAVSMYSILKSLKDDKSYSSSNLTRSKKLFNI